MTTPAPAREREPFWDNAKGVLVTFVVLGHAIQPSAAAGVVLADVLYRVVYLFHMPAFVFVTGVLTAELTARRAGRLVTTVLVPYVIFQVLQTIEVSVLRGRWAGVHLLDPRWTLWFLLALVVWRLSAPLWLALRPAVAIAGAVGVAILSGLEPGVTSTLGLDATLGFLPFFVLGLVLRRQGEMLLRPRRPWVVAGAGAVVVGAVLVTLVTRHEISRRVLQLGFRPQVMDAGLAVELAVRVALLAGATALTAAALVLIPRRRTVFASVGLASMTVYLLHPLVLTPLRDGRLAGGTVVAVLTMAAAVGLALLLSSRPVVAAARPLVEPSWTGRVLLRSPAAGPRARARGGATATDAEAERSGS